jgi:alpha-galactosidase
LGDWQVNGRKLPRGLSYLADEAKVRGLGFGIWIEPEMVNPQSDLHERHPDWAIRQPHREPELSRHQLVLDLTRPAVRDHAQRVIDETLGGNPGISYVKWDANRFVTQPGSTFLSAEEQSHLLINYNLVLYDLMQHMATTYSNVTGMVCAGGGGRVDYGALRYFHSFWPSDNTDPRSRVFIQWGFSHFFPANTISSHVTRMGRRPLKFAIDVAMSGAMGVDMDLSKASAEERKTLASAITLYRGRLREIVQQGDLYRLESPYESPRAALMYVSPDRTRAVLFVYQLRDHDVCTVALRGLNPAARYLVREVNVPSGAASHLKVHGQTIDALTLMQTGLTPLCRSQFESTVVELEAVTE